MRKNLEILQFLHQRRESGSSSNDEPNEEELENLKRALRGDSHIGDNTPPKKSRHASKTNIFDSFTTPMKSVGKNTDKN